MKSIHFYLHRVPGMFQLQSWRLVVGDEVASVAFGERDQPCATVTHMLPWVELDLFVVAVPSFNNILGHGFAHRSLWSKHSLSWWQLPSYVLQLLRSGCGGVWGAVLLVGAVFPGPLPGVSLSSFLSYIVIVFIVSSSLIVSVLSLSNYRNSFETIVSYRYRTILPKHSVRYPTLV